MLTIIKLEVFGFQGGATYELGKNGVSHISSLPSSEGYFVHYESNETIYITGSFQFVATEAERTKQ